MFRKPKWVKSLIALFGFKRESQPTHRELVDEDFPIRRLHKMCVERTVELPLYGSSNRSSPHLDVPEAPYHQSADSQLEFLQTFAVQPPALSADTQTKIAGLVRQSEKPEKLVGRRSEGSLVALARKTVNELPALPPGRDQKAHWFNGQDRYSSRPGKNSDSFNRLESFLSTRKPEEIKSLDPSFEWDDELPKR